MTSDTRLSVPYGENSFVRCASPIRGCRLPTNKVAVWHLEAMASAAEDVAAVDDSLAAGAGLVSLLLILWVLLSVRWRLGEGPSLPAEPAVGDAEEAVLLLVPSLSPRDASALALPPAPSPLLLPRPPKDPPLFNAEASPTNCSADTCTGAAFLFLTLTVVVEVVGSTISRYVHVLLPLISCWKRGQSTKIPKRE